ncbi:hypothetical protein TSAR_007799 [Trichomalopsis sarcophagae]|uniref:Uncharacterized protein n=1 Tax=Trichomalopsis sarcophagae TaxID=543379 RepID=A0A232F049_9HYME|nr:hypothetical protein TSAR_007799 [Trichomalopsis sarcophagae]
MIRFELLSFLFSVRCYEKLLASLGALVKK